MQQYFAKNKNLELENSDYHHIKNVMRMKTGDVIKIVYDNTVYECKLTFVSDKSSFEILSKKQIENHDIKIDVAFSLIKEQKLDFLLQKATEIGVNDFFALNAKRSVVKIDFKKEALKIERWNRICKEAAEQSFRSFVPTIKGILNIDELIKQDYDLKLFCSLSKNTENIKKVLQKNKKCVKILLVVGPEGGFDPAEEEFLLENGFISVSLGKNVLRSETAPVVALSMINYEFMR